RRLGGDGLVGPDPDHVRPGRGAGRVEPAHAVVVVRVRRQTGVVVLGVVLAQRGERREAHPVVGAFELEAVLVLGPVVEGEVRLVRDGAAAQVARRDGRSTGRRLGAGDDQG